MLLNKEGICVDVAKLSMAMNQANLKQQANLAVMKKAMNTAEVNGNALIEMLQKSAPHPNLGDKVDVKV